MKKVLCSIAVALLILTLTGCADMVWPVQQEEHPPQPEVAILPESTGPIGSETVPFSASNDPVEEPPVTEEPETDPEPEVPARLPTAPPQNVPAPNGQPTRRKHLIPSQFSLRSQSRSRNPHRPSRPLRNRRHPFPTNRLNRRSASTTGSAMPRSTPKAQG